MTCPARHPLCPAEVGDVDSRHHLDHPARVPLNRRIGHEICFVGAGAWMTVGAIETERRRDHPHRLHEIVDRKPLQTAGCDVLEELSRRLSWCGPCWCLC